MLRLSKCRNHSPYGHDECAEGLFHTRKMVVVLEKTVPLAIVEVSGYSIVTKLVWYRLISI